jgi:hypothetical protein
MHQQLIRDYSIQLLLVLALVLAQPLCLLL